MEADGSVATESSAHIERLPDELLLRIFAHTLLTIEQLCMVNADRGADLRQISRLCLVSSHFRTVAQPLIYQTLQFTQTDPLCDGYQFSSSQEFTYLRRRPDEIQIVRHLVLKGTPLPVARLLEAFEDPAIQSQIQQTYSTSFCTFLDSLIVEAREVTTTWPHSVDVSRYRGHYVLSYDLLAIWLLTLADQVEFASLRVVADSHGSLLARFFSFCGRALGTADRGLQARLPSPLSRLHTLELTPMENDIGTVSNAAVSAFLSFQGLVSCYTSYLSWGRGSSAPSNPGAPSRPWPIAPHIQHLELRSAAFPGTPRNPKSSSLVIRDLVLRELGSDLRSLVVDVDPKDADAYDEYPRARMDFGPLGEAIRTYGTGLRRFELQLYKTAAGQFEERDSGVLGNLRAANIKLEWLSAPMSRLTYFEHPKDGVGAYPGDHDKAYIPPDFADLGDYLPPSLRYFWTSIPNPRFYNPVPHHDLSHDLGSLLASAEAKLPQLEWVLVHAPYPNCQLRHGYRTYQYWAEETMGPFHYLYRRRQGPGCRNTLGPKQHPPEWKQAIKHEIAMSFE
ncbi:uncharacterized protein B0I36DRAFT_338973 [Microdochium trichocladiopsis]|uniref:F-box domain-containing protein n=1 Tax=Microdochium trichocladiopsis TaxID=1682393 RepID=A0A9P8XSI9_9PEZI|nr:uncharacterized protein B0I36DRAFT_338973 [Microdochium trichocladiopsis]KAH7014619.1 hypothetical protein B0I36DRAFT_338973 [Microdochium trichocladiopsis]